MMFEKFKCYVKDFVALDQYKFFIKFNSVNGMYVTRSRRTQITGMSTRLSCAAA